MPVDSPHDLSEVLRRLNALSGGAHQRALATSLGAEALALVKEGFRTSTDPYGRPWKPPALRAGRPLEDTGRLRNAFQVRAQPGLVEVDNNTSYALPNQEGATILPKRAKALKFKARGGRWYTLAKSVIPARMMVPEGGAMPERWAERLSAVGWKVLDGFSPAGA
jgi:phage gpG-like protein